MGKLWLTLFIMWVNRLKINNLRNHIQTELAFSKHLNIIYGQNGSGKTTILEALSITAFSKSFNNVPENSIINFEKDFFKVSCEGVRDRGTKITVSVEKANRSRKKISSNYMDNLKPKDLIGSIPMVILSPDYKEITAGSPSARRSFVDRLLSQLNHSYLNNLIDFKRTLKQRNNFLHAVSRDNPFDNNEFKLWTEKLIDLSTKIVHKRSIFLEEYKPYFKSNYKKVSAGKEEVDIKYKPYGFPDTYGAEVEEKDIKKILEGLAAEKRKDELIRKTTLFGPQKDEFLLELNNGLTREVASQGQHKSFLISLKLAEFDYLKESLNETPVVLLDDIFSELDEFRTKFVIDLVLNNLAQAFVTITESEKIQKIMKPGENCYYFKVDSGEVEYIPFDYE